MRTYHCASRQNSHRWRWSTISKIMFSSPLPEPLQSQRLLLSHLLFDAHELSYTLAALSRAVSTPSRSEPEHLHHGAPAVLVPSFPFHQESRALCENVDNEFWLPGP